MTLDALCPGNKMTGLQNVPVQIVQDTQCLEVKMSGTNMLDPRGTFCTWTNPDIRHLNNLRWTFSRGCRAEAIVLNNNKSLLCPQNVGLSNRNLFRRTVLQKCGIETLGLWITAREWRIPASHNPNQNSTVPCRIFSSNKSVPANRKKGFYTNRDPQEVGFIFV